LALRKAAAVQWIGVGLVFMCSVVTPPFAHAITGTAGYVGAAYLGSGDTSRADRSGARHTLTGAAGYPNGLVVLHVVIRLKIDADLDERVAWVRRIELKPIETKVAGRKVV
jgi:hypothetical protein